MPGMNVVRLKNESELDMYERLEVWHSREDKISTEKGRGTGKIKTEIESRTTFS